MRTTTAENTGDFHSKRKEWRKYCIRLAGFMATKDECESSMLALPREVIACNLSLRTRRDCSPECCRSHGASRKRRGQMRVSKIRQNEIRWTACRRRTQFAAAEAKRA